LYAAEAIQGPGRTAWRRSASGWRRRRPACTGPASAGRRTPRRY